MRHPDLGYLMGYFGLLASPSPFSTLPPSSSTSSHPHPLLRALSPPYPLSILNPREICTYLPPSQLSPRGVPTKEGRFHISQAPSPPSPDFPHFFDSPLSVTLRLSAILRYLLFAFVLYYPVYCFLLISSNKGIIYPAKEKSPLHQLKLSLYIYLSQSRSATTTTISS